MTIKPIAKPEAKPQPVRQIEPAVDKKTSLIQKPAPLITIPQDLAQAYEPMQQEIAGVVDQEEYIRAEK